ncbi:MAG TPA: polar amino acid ABC transporter permease [Ruminococcaceae bacterium]|nr:polar amino acid ABC transporter permease [Oscillospiraceae bacterium]
MTFQQVTIDLLVGFVQNCKLFFLTLVMAIPLGFVFTFGSRSKFAPLKWLTRTFVWIIRGTPLMLQLFVVFYVPGMVFDTPMRDRMLAAVVAFVINYACYFSEIYRGGIDSIPAGQYEAGQVLGMTKSQIFFKVVLQQLIKRIVPPMGNEIITLVKDTSLARVISVNEMLVAAERFSGKGLIWPLFYTGVFFLIFNGVLTILLHYVEKKLDYYRG